MRYLAWTGKPFMFWGEIPGFLDRGPVGRFMRSQLQSPLKAACGIAAIGEVAEKAYQRLFPKKQVFNIPYFCDLDPYRSAASANRKQPSEKLEIIFSGQLIDRKGVDVLLAAFARVGRENARLHLRLLGSGPKGDHYRSMVPQEIANRIDFAGHVDPQELPEIFAKADIFCLPSRHDGWGVVVNEALGAGLPIIVSDKVGAGADLVQHGRNGLITSAGDVDALADALRLLGSDDNLRASMAEESRIISEDWGIDEGVRRWEHAAKTTLDAWQAA
jgi:glycosyltransferase involved in cell wall biosynthesis